MAQDHRDGHGRQRLTGGQALVQSLKRHGVEVIFGLPGVQLDWAFDALYDERDSIALYQTRHEQATAYMADGYARTTGRVGTNLVVPGPGLLNAMAGLSTAYACNSPVLCISGQIQSDLIECGYGMLHEIPNQLEMVRSVTKWSGRAMTPEEVPALVSRAFQELRSGRPRPVEIEIPPDVLAATRDVALLDPEPQPAAPEIDPDLLERAARALGQAANPVIVAGGGAVAANAHEELQELAEMLQAPVIMSSSGKGALSSRHYLAQTLIAGAELLAQADVILLTGTRLVDYVTAERWTPRAGQTVIRLDIDPAEMTRTFQPDIGLIADAREGLAALVDRAGRYNRQRSSRKDELSALQQKIDDLLFEVQPQASYALTIREEMPDDAILVSDMTQVAYWADLAFPVYAPRSFITPGYQGTLGAGFATALGAQVGNPDKKVISINGDGGFMFNVQELATMALHNIKLIAIVFSDNAYGNVMRTQRQDFNGRVIGTGLHNPDFARLAETFGVQGMRAKGPEGLRTALRDALKSDLPTVIEVPVDEMPNIDDVIATFGTQLSRL